LLAQRLIVENFRNASASCERQLMNAYLRRERVVQLRQHSQIAALVGARDAVHVGRDALGHALNIDGGCSAEDAAEILPYGIGRRRCVARMSGVL
jgi:hypothetical protein